MPCIKRKYIYIYIFFWGSLHIYDTTINQGKNYKGKNIAKDWYISNKVKND